MRHPGIFGAVGSHGGDIYFEACYRPLFWPFLNAAKRAGGVDRLLDHFLTLPKKNHRAYVAALSMCYSPIPNRPPYYFDLPMDVETDELLPQECLSLPKLAPGFMADFLRVARRTIRTILL